MFFDKKCNFFSSPNLALNVSKSVKYWCKCIHLAKINWLLHEQCARGCKRVMLESKLTLKIWMHLWQKMSLHNIWFVHGFLTFTYTQKRYRTLPLLVIQIWCSFIRTNLGQIKDLGLCNYPFTKRWRQNQMLKNKVVSSQICCMPAQLLLVNGCQNTGALYLIPIEI